MSGASDEVEKFMKVRHANSLPKGYTIEFGFADKHTLKDGPSAAVACALMTNASSPESLLIQGSLQLAI